MTFAVPVSECGVSQCHPVPPRSHRNRAAPNLRSSDTESPAMHSRPAVWQ
jgi:hypothetical protein